jgi:hypothetical protein
MPGVASVASNSATMSETSQSRSDTPAAIAGVTRLVDANKIIIGRKQRH